MKRENFYRRDPGAALSGMAGMTLEERGVYNTIIDLLYLTWRPLEDSAAYIAGHCGCAVQKLNPILRRLIDAGKLVRFEEDGRSYISNPAFERERVAVKGTSQSRSGRAPRSENSAGVEEKSREVEEKSGGVEKNPPSCVEKTQPDQPFMALEKSREEKTRHSVPNGTGVDPPPDPLGDIRSLEPKARAWALARRLLVQRGSLTEAKAGSLIGKLMRDHRLEPDGLWAIAEAAWVAGTEDPLAYLIKAASALAERRGSAGADPFLHPDEQRQAMWMQEYHDRPSSWAGRRGPRPGERGCRVSPEIQKRFGICPFGEAPAATPDLLTFADPKRRVA